MEKTLPTFKDAASRREDDADMWELLAELLASRDPAGVREVWLTGTEHLGIVRRVRLVLLRIAQTCGSCWLSFWPAATQQVVISINVWAS